MLMEKLVVVSLFINLLAIVIILCLLHKRMTEVENKILELIVWMNRKFNEMEIKAISAQIQEQKRH
jgi:hypothetical protein